MQKRYLIFIGSLTFLSCISTRFVSYAAEPEVIETPQAIVVEIEDEPEDTEIEEKEIEPFDYKEVNYSQLEVIGTYTVTAYCGCEICCGKWSSEAHLTYTGTTATEGRTIAADGDSLGYGSSIYIDGLGERVIEDKPAERIINKYGGKIIDVYFDSHSKALEFGKQELAVYREEEHTVRNSMNIRIADSDSAIDFVRKTNEFSEDLDLVDGRIEIDAKSIMGVCSLDLTKTLELRLHSDDEETIKHFNEVFAEYLED